MPGRPITDADLADVTALCQRWELAYYGKIESDEDETAETLDQGRPLDRSSLLVVQDDRAVGAVWRSHADVYLTVDPQAARDVADELVAWLETQGAPHAPALETDAPIRDVLEQRGWRHQRSSFDLLRDVAEDWALAEPDWPSGIAVRTLGVDDAPAIHHLIYAEAAWAEIPGHPARDLEEWRALFLTSTTVPDQQVFAFQDERLVGVAIGRIFSDGTGWVSQLAVARDERGRGLGRALLLEALRRQRAAGATSLGLSVQAENRGALALYLGVGLRIEREWMEYDPSPYREAGGG